MKYLTFLAALLGVGLMGCEQRLGPNPIKSTPTGNEIKEIEDSNRKR